MKNIKKCNEISFMSMQYTTILKGVAILIIMLSHMANSWGVRWFTPLGGIGVAMFLTVSGYGLAESYKKTGLKDYWVKKFINVYIPYVFIRGIIIIISLLMGAQYDLTDIIMGFVFIKKLHAYDWYMGYLFIWYFIFYIVNLVNTDNKKKFWLFIFAGIVMFFAFDKNLYAEQAISFLFGIYLSYYNKNSDKSFLKGFMLFTTGIVALALKQLPVIRSLDISVVWNFIQLVNKFCISCGIIYSLYSIINIINLKLFYYIGIISFELYLIHGYTIKLLKYGNLQGSVAFIISSFLLAWVANKIISLCTAFLKRRMMDNGKSISKIISNSQ